MNGEWGKSGRAGLRLGEELKIRDSGFQIEKQKGGQSPRAAYPDTSGSPLQSIRAAGKRQTEN